jgi:hypothetical protein
MTSTLSWNQAKSNSDRDDTQLADFLHGRRGPSLGEMRHLLKSTPDGIQREWTDYLDGLRDGRELRTGRFREFIHKVAEAYRNGGAHNSAIPMATAESCLRNVVGEIGEPGWLAKVVFVKASANEHPE